MDHLLVMKLREYNCELRALKSSLNTDNLSSVQAVDVMRRRKDEMMKSVYDILCICLGTPPKADKKLSWEYYDRDGKFCKMEISPTEIYQKYTGPHLAGDCFSLINDPRNKYDTLYTVNRLGNVWGARPVQCEYSVTAG
jgi:bleomycin hydrolase